MRPFYEREQAVGVAWGETASILYFEGNATLPDRQHKIYLWLLAARWEVGDIEIRDGAQKISRCTFGDVSSQVGQMRRAFQAIWREGNDFLQPGGPQAVIAQAEFGGAALTFEPQFQGGMSCNSKVLSSNCK